MCAAMLRRGVGCNLAWGHHRRASSLWWLLPYAWGDLSGLVEDARSITRDGLADARVKVSISLLGNDAMRYASSSRRRDGRSSAPAR